MQPDSPKPGVTDPMSDDDKKISTTGKLATTSLVLHCNHDNLLSEIPTFYSMHSHIWNLCVIPPQDAFAFPGSSRSQTYSQLKLAVSWANKAVLRRRKKGRVKSRHTAHEPETRRMYNCAPLAVIALCTLAAGKTQENQDAMPRTLSGVRSVGYFVKNF